MLVSKCLEINSDLSLYGAIFIFAPCILVSIQFAHQQMHFLLNLKKFKIYIKIHINVSPTTCFGL
jgi:hypothetical protein